ncbi:hypothetical protein [Carboxylicivirga sp. N1E11]
MLPLLLSSHGMMAKTEQKKENDTIQPGKRQAILILSDGTKVNLTASDTLNYYHATEKHAKIDSTMHAQIPNTPLTNKTLTVETSEVLESGGNKITEVGS